MFFGPVPIWAIHLSVWYSLFRHEHGRAAVLALSPTRSLETPGDSCSTHQKSTCEELESLNKERSRRNTLIRSNAALVGRRRKIINRASCSSLRFFSGPTPFPVLLIPGWTRDWALGGRMCGYNMKLSVEIEITVCFFTSIIHEGTYICDTENMTMMIILTEMARSLSVLSSIHQRQQGQPTQHKPSCCSVGGGMQQAYLGPEGVSGGPPPVGGVDKQSNANRVPHCGWLDSFVSSGRTCLVIPWNTLGDTQGFTTEIPSFLNYSTYHIVAGNKDHCHF